MMDITLLQMAQKTAVAPKTQTSTSTPETSFDKVLNNAVKNESVKADAQQPTEKSDASEQLVKVETKQVVEDVTEVLEADSLEEVLNILDVEHDDAMLFVVLDGELKPIEETLNVDDLAGILNMSAEDLQEVLTQLTGEEVETKDVWSILEQSPQLLAQITAVLQGENQVVTPKEAGQLAKFLQLAQMVGQQVDTVSTQEVTLVDTKQALQQFSQQLTNNQQPVSLQQNTFSQAVQAAVSTMNESQTRAQVQTTSSTMQSESVDKTTATDTAPVVVQQASQSAVKTVSVVLPMERSAQSEALVKEIQNQLNRAQISNNNGTIKLMLRLFPENLGQIRIEIMQQDGVMQARILATTSAGKELLDSSLHQLKTSLVAQNIQMDRIDIAQSLQTSDASTNQGFFNQFFKQQDDLEESEEQTGDEEEISFDELLNEQLQLEEV